MIKKRAFTLAEALTTLTILGVIAALTLPQIIGNFHEHANITAQKAFINDMRNAIQLIAVQDGKLNKLKNKGSYSSLNEAFVKEKLMDVLKFSTVCNVQNNEYEKCGINTGTRGYSSFDIIGGSGDVKLDGLKNSDFITNTVNSTNNDDLLQAAHLINGASILVAYNPDCEKRASGDALEKKHLCLNILYDVNGKQEPNQFGRDVGILSVFSSKKPVVSGAIPYEGGNLGSMSFAEAVEECKNMATSGRAGLPTEDEALSLLINKTVLLGKNADDASWTNLLNTSSPKNSSDYVICVHRN